VNNSARLNHRNTSPSGPLFLPGAANVRPATSAGVVKTTAPTAKARQPTPRVPSAFFTGQGCFKLLHNDMAFSPVFHQLKGKIGMSTARNR
jgi:hypothetical protein